MIQITDIDGRRCYLAPTAIASVSEAGQSYHGIRSVVRTFDGRTIDARETAEEIADLLAKDAEAR